MSATGVSIVSWDLSGTPALDRPMTAMFNRDCSVPDRMVPDQSVHYVLITEPPTELARHGWPACRVVGEAGRSSMTETPKDPTGPRHVARCSAVGGQCVQPARQFSTQMTMRDPIPYRDRPAGPGIPPHCQPSGDQGVIPPLGCDSGRRRHSGDSVRGSTSPARSGGYAAGSAAVSRCSCARAT